MNQKLKTQWLRHVVSAFCAACGRFVRCFGRPKYITDVVLLLLVVLQVVFWSFSKEIKPDFTVVPPVPTEASVKALSLGDEQFYFRALGLKIQNAGDTFGRFTALKDYDYEGLSQWFALLDTLDTESNFIPALAGYYYSQTQYVPDVRYIVDYLDTHASRDLYNKWWWMSQAVYLANHRLKDKQLALELSYKLASTPRDDVPMWVKQMPAFIHEQLGEEQQALIIIKDIVDNADKLEWGEANFMRYFVEERLKQFLADHPELDKIRPENIDAPEDSGR